MLRERPQHGRIQQDEASEEGERDGEEGDDVTQAAHRFAQGSLDAREAHHLELWLKIIAVSNALKGVGGLGAHSDPDACELTRQVIGGLNGLQGQKDRAVDLRPCAGEDPAHLGGVEGLGLGVVEQVGISSASLLELCRLEPQDDTVSFEALGGLFKPAPVAHLERERIAPPRVNALEQGHPCVVSR